MKKIPILFTTVLVLAPIAAMAVGTFVAPKPVWDNHQDISEPEQKAILVFDGGQEDMILQVKYAGPMNDFGWLIPVPNLPTVQNGSMKCFTELNGYTQQHLRPNYTRAMARPAPGIDRRSDQPPVPPPVQTIEAITVGDYKIAVLSANDSGALEQWLATNHFNIRPNKADVLDSYVKSHWYFVAIKVSLGDSSSGTSRPVTAELNPLQISFASDHCIFPLRISSMNGEPSEVQVDVLSPEPLVEGGMLEAELPTIYKNDSETAAARAEQWRRNRLYQRNHNRRFMGAAAPDNSPLPPEEVKAVEGTAKTLMPTPDELIPCAKVTKDDLPDCSQAILRLANNPWWLTEQRWTLQPEDMRDLDFEPAWPFLTQLLGTQYGYFADASLTSFGTDGIPAILAAMQSTNATVRTTASAIFYCQYGGYTSYGNWQPETMHDPRIIEAAPGWLKDSEPMVRCAGIMAMIENWDPKFAEPLIAMLRDKNPDVRFCATAMLSSSSPAQFYQTMQSHTAELEQMLKDNDPDVRGAALQVLQRMGAQIQLPRDELMSFFTSHDYRVLDAAFGQMQEQGEKLSDDDALVLLQNPEPVAKLLGLAVLGQTPTKQSIELALPLLQDPTPSVRFRADQTLRVLTGQSFTENQSDQWVKWWDANKSTVVVQLHTEAMWRQSRP